MKIHKNKKAFTLVELIVVITIIAILGTIAFISLQGYSADARDSSRISDINHIKTSLELQSLASGKYPMPDNSQQVTLSGGTVVVWHQGTVGENVTKILSRNLSEKPTDPLYNTEYIYSVTPTQGQYEVMSIYEGDMVYLQNLGIESANASSNTVRIDGTYNGVYVKSDDYIIPTPSIITSLDPNGLILDETTINSQVINRGTNVPNIGTTKITQSTGALTFSTFEVYNGTLNEESSTGAFLLAYQAIANTYNGSSLASEGVIKILLEQATEEQQINFTKSLVLNTPTGIISSDEGDNGGETPTYSCTGTLPTQNVSTSNDTGLSADTPRQNTASGDNCYYVCTLGYTGDNCDIEPALITSTDCTDAGWIWIDSTTDVYIGTTKGDGFCISPRFGDWQTNGTDLNDGAGGISWNGWGNDTNTYYQGWDASSVDDYDYATYIGNPYPQYGQTRKLDSEVTYNCKPLGTASSDYDTSDTIVGRMKWLATTGNTYTQARSIDWITGLVPHTVGTYPHAIPALYIADCIDGVKDLGTTMTYTGTGGITDEVTYTEYNTEVTTVNTDTAYLSDTTYQNRQKYLTAWTQRSGSHLPSAFSYITEGYASASDSDGDFLLGADRGEYQVACDAGKFGTVTWNGGTQYTGANDNTDNERIWLSAIGHTPGTGRGRYARLVVPSGCGGQGTGNTGGRDGATSARFVVRP